MAVRYRFDGLLYEPERRDLTREGAVNTLPMQEAVMLEAFLCSAGRVLTKQELAQFLWPEERYGEFDLAITNLISKLRRSLGEDARDARYIKTMPKTGYRMICDVAVETLGALPSASPPLPPAVENPPPIIALVQPVAGSRWILWTVLLFLAVSVLAASIYLLRPRRPAVPEPTILGILPLTVTGSNSDFTEETIRGELADAVAQIPGVQVRAAHSLTAEMGRNAASLQQAAHELSLNLLLTGTLSLSEKSYQFDLELVRGSNGDHLRSFHFVGPLLGLSNLPSQVESALFHYLRQPSQAPAAAPEVAGATVSAEAYADAFQASQYLTERTKDSLQRAVQLFSHATRLDPNFARAFSGLAESYLVLADLGSNLDVSANFDKAAAAAAQAIHLDPGDARAHSVLGLILFQRDWNLNGAEHEMRTAIQLNPGLAANHMRLAVLLTDKMNFAAARSEIALAHDLDPLWPVVFGTGMYVHLMARDYPAAIEAGHSLVSLRPDWGRAHQQLGWALWYGGQHAAAIGEWQQAATLDHDSHLAQQEERGLAILQESGTRAYAHAKLAAWKDTPSNGDFVPAEWHAFAGDKAETLDALEKLVRNHDPESLKIPVNPAYDFLRNDPRFKALLLPLSR